MTLLPIFLFSLCLLASYVCAEPPIITSPLMNQIVAEDHMVSFICKAEGSPEPTFTWEREGRRIDLSRRRFHVYSIPQGSVLRIDPVRTSDGNKMYTCVARNDLGESARSAAYLTVNSLYSVEGTPSGYPQITRTPALTVVEKGRQATLRCAAAGDNVQIQWLKDYVPLDVDQNPRLTILPGGSLQIDRSKESDEGRYECTAYNNVGVAYSYAARLYVRVRRVPPRFTRLPGVYEVQPGDGAELTCVAVGSPMPLVQWRDGETDLGTPKIGRNKLVLENVTKSKNYTCVAYSRLGQIESVWRIVVNGQQ